MALGSTSALKQRALEKALKRLGLEAEILTYSAKSGVSDQPVGYEEMFQGAAERARQALVEVQGADYAVGMENGLVPIMNEGYFDVCAVFIVRPDGMESRGFGPGMRIPFWMEKLVLEEGREVGKIIQERQPGAEKDSYRYFSKGLTNREEAIEMAVVQAFVPLLNQDLYVAE